jgi:uncharacterized protein YutE (UPF0331/DUF86 family)
MFVTPTNVEDRVSVWITFQWPQWRLFRLPKTIRELTSTSPREEVLNDPWKMRGIRYSVQTSIEAMVDVAYHLAAKLYGYPPVDVRDAFQTLRRHGLISAADFETYAAMVSFRNRLVHGYQDISPEQLYDLITHGLSDFDRFVETITSFLSKK